MKYVIAMLSVVLWALPVQSQETDKSFQGFNLQGYDDEGGKAWDVDGETADVSGEKITVRNVNASSYGERSMNLTAETGYIDQDQSTFRLENDVIVTSDEGPRLVTDSLDWYRDEDLVTTDDDVFITDEGFSLSGKGMDARPGFKDATIRKDVTVRVDTKSDSFDANVLEITSDGPMVMKQAESLAIFEDNVVAVQGDQQLRADKMEIYFDEQMTTILRIVCTGHVEIEQGENRTYADSAIYDAIRQRITLSGRPKLILVTEGENAITTFGN